MQRVIWGKPRNITYKKGPCTESFIKPMYRDFEKHLPMVSVLDGFS